MQVLRLLAARGRKRRAVSTITTAAHARSVISEAEEDEGPFFDLDFSSASVRASSSSSSSSDDDDWSELDFIISLHHRNRTLGLDFKPAALPPPLRALSFGSSTTAKSSKTTNNTLYGGRPSFAGSTRSLRLFMESPDPDPEEEDAVADGTKPAQSGAVPVLMIRRYLAGISRRLRRSARPPPPPPRRRRPPPGGSHLRKSRSASAAVAPALPPPRRDDSLVEKQDGIDSAIAHCKASFHSRASLLSDCGDSSLLRSRSDPGKCEASTQ